MKYRMLILGALLLFGVALAGSRSALAAPTMQAAPPAQATAKPTVVKPPANLPGPQPNEVDGYFPAVCLVTGILFAGIAAFVSVSRDGRKARRLQRSGGSRASMSVKR
ncbi:MAG: hypothetical protein ACR2M0_08250 [Chloroflexia bacterium]